MGDIKLIVDVEKTRAFYADKSGFVCDCKDCINYTRQYDLIKKVLDGIDDQLGIDISKDVGIGMEELMPHDYPNHHLYLIPYYAIGSAWIDEIELKEKYQHRIDESLTWSIQKTEYGKQLFAPDSAITIWFEFKTPLVSWEDITGYNTD